MQKHPSDPSNGRCSSAYRSSGRLLSLYESCCCIRAGFTIVFARVALGALTLAMIIAAIRAPFPKGLKTWIAFLGMGIVNNVIPMSLIVYGTSKIDAGLASIINAMTPLFAIIIAHFATQDERLTANRLLGVILGVLGVIVLIGPGLIFGSTINIWGELACLAATLSYASASIFGRRFARMNLKPMQIAFGQTLSASVVLFPISWVIDQPLTIAQQIAFPLQSFIKILRVSRIAL